MLYAIPILTIALTASAAQRQTTPQPSDPDFGGLYNVAQTSLGATAKGSGSAFNKDWPPNNAIGPESQCGRRHDLRQPAQRRPG